MKKLLLLLAVCIVAMGLAGTALATCSTNFDCTNQFSGSYCDGSSSMCIFSSNSICTTHAECSSQFSFALCSNINPAVGGFCYFDPTPTTPTCPSTPCTDPDESCINGVCINSSNYCSTNTGCNPPTTICVSNQCVPNPNGGGGGGTTSPSPLTVNLVNPLCPTGNAGTCDTGPSCNGTGYQNNTGPLGTATGYLTLSACCTAWGGTITGGTGTCISEFSGILTAVRTFVNGIVATLAIIVIIWAGILFVTSAGNVGKIDLAKKALLFAAIGIAIVLAGNGLIELITAIIGPAPT